MSKPKKALHRPGGPVRPHATCSETCRLPVAVASKIRSMRTTKLTSHTTHTHTIYPYLVPCAHMTCLSPRDSSTLPRKLDRSALPSPSSPRTTRPSPPARSIEHAIYCTANAAITRRWMDRQGRCRKWFQPIRSCMHSTPMCFVSPNGTGVSANQSPRLAICVRPVIYTHTYVSFCSHHMHAS